MSERASTVSRVTLEFNIGPGTPISVRSLLSGAMHHIRQHDGSAYIRKIDATSATPDPLISEVQFCVMFEELSDASDAHHTSREMWRVMYGRLACASCRPRHISCQALMVVLEEGLAEEWLRSSTWPVFMAEDVRVALRALEMLAEQHTSEQVSAQ